MHARSLRYLTGAARDGWRRSALPPPRRLSRVPRPAKGRCRAPPSLRLVDIPEDRRRRTVEYAGQRFPPGARREILPERDIDHLVIGFLLDVGGDLLLLFR